MTQVLKTYCIVRYSLLSDWLESFYLCFPQTSFFFHILKHLIDRARVMETKKTKSERKSLTSVSSLLFAETGKNC